MWLVELQPVEDLWLGRSDHDHALRCGTDDPFYPEGKKIFLSCSEHAAGTIVWRV